MSSTFGEEDDADLQQCTDVYAEEGGKEPDGYGSGATGDIDAPRPTVCSLSNTRLVNYAPSARDEIVADMDEPKLATALKYAQDEVWLGAILYGTKPHLGLCGPYNKSFRLSYIMQYGLHY